MQKKLFTFALLFLVIASKNASAKVDDLSVYDKPEENAKIVTTIKNDQEIIPIFYPKDGKWVKIADPQNGDTGWVKAEKIKSPKTVTKITVADKQKNDNSTEMYRMIQCSNTKNLSDKDTKQAAKQAVEASRKIESSMQKMHERMRSDMAEIFKEFDKDFQDLMVITKNR